MNPVLESVDAISYTCEKVLTCEPITGEHYSVLEVQIVCIEKYLYA